MKIQIILLVSVLFISSCTQTAYRWRNDDGDEASATWLAEINEPAVYDGSGNIRLRLQLDFSDNNYISSGNNEAQALGGALYYSLSITGPWTRITDDMNNAFVLSHSNYLTDGELTTNLLPPVPNSSFRSGKVYTSTFTDSFSDISGSIFSEFEWSIKSTPNAEPNIYYFTAGEVLENSGPVKVDIEATAVDDQGNDLNIPRINDYAMLMFSPKNIPLRNWSFAILGVLISGFLIYRFRKKLA